MLNLFPKKSSWPSATFTIAGMHCASCAMNIDGTLEDTPGVISASTNYAKAETEVEYDPNQISVEELQATISGTGYPATVKKS